MEQQTPPSRSLSKNEAQVMSRLELERPPFVDIQNLVDQLEWPRHKAKKTLSSLARKGWLQPLSGGRYEPLLAETGGVPLPNPWAALSAWPTPYYVAFQSAAYELDLTPDRPRLVQAAVKLGVRRPRGWRDVAIDLIPLLDLSLEGTHRETQHNKPIQLAGVEKVLLDGAAMPQRVGGVFGLARILARAAEKTDWDCLLELSVKSTHGGPAIRRIATLLTILDTPVPQQVVTFAEARSRARMDLGPRSIHGRAGVVVKPWLVRLNVSPEAIKEDVRR